MTLRQHHASLNQRTRSLRDTYTDHRDRIMRLIEAGKRASGNNATRTAVLGAGNCNDIDLPWMTQQFDEVHLVDLDNEAINFGCSDPSLVQNRIHRHCPIDVASPLHDILESVLQTEAADQPTDIAADWIQQLQMPSQPLPIQACDVVVSVGLLSQLMLSIDRALAHLPPQTVLPLIQMVRREHFRRVLSMLRPASEDQPGGVAVFGFDFVSSDTASEIPETPDDKLEPLAVKLINQRNFFTGMNPGVLLQELKIIPDCKMLHIQSPWRWTLGPRQYLMMAAVVQKIDNANQQ